MNEQHVIYKTAYGAVYRCDEAGDIYHHDGDDQCWHCSLPVQWATLDKGDLFTVGYDRGQYIMRVLVDWNFSLDKWLMEQEPGLNAWQIKNQLVKDGLAGEVKMSAHVRLGKDKDTSQYLSRVEV